MATLDVDEEDRREEREYVLDQIFGMTNPKAYKQYVENRKRTIEEQAGAETVTWKGEESWSQIMEEFKEFGLDGIDPFGEGMK